jgi:hypothetical protein
VSVALRLENALPAHLQYQEVQAVLDQEQVFPAHALTLLQQQQLQPLYLDYINALVVWMIRGI